METQRGDAAGSETDFGLGLGGRVSLMRAHTSTASLQATSDDANNQGGRGPIASTRGRSVAVTASKAVSRGLATAANASGGGKQDALSAAHSLVGARAWLETFAKGPFLYFCFFCTALKSVESCQFQCPVNCHLCVVIHRKRFDTQALISPSTRTMPTST